MDMKPTTEKEMELSFRRLTQLPKECPPELGKKIGMLRQYLNERTLDTSITSSEIYQFLK